VDKMMRCDLSKIIAKGGRLGHVVTSLWVVEAVTLRRRNLSF